METVGLVGVGKIGLPIAENLIKSGYRGIDVWFMPMPMSDVFTRFQNGQVAMFGAGRWPILRTHVLSNVLGRRVRENRRRDDPLAG